MSDTLKIRAGFVGFGEVNTPREFIDNRCRIAADELKKRGIELVETAPVSDDPAGLQAARAVEELKKEYDRLEGEGTVLDSEVEQPVAVDTPVVMEEYVEPVEEIKES